MNDTVSNETTDTTSSEAEPSELESQEAQAAEAQARQTQARREELKVRLASGEGTANDKREYRRLTEATYFGGDPNPLNEAQQNLQAQRDANPDAPNDGTADRIAASHTVATDNQLESALTSALGMDADVFDAEDRNAVISTVRYLGVPNDVAKTLMSEFCKAHQYPDVSEQEYTELSFAAVDILTGMWGDRSASDEANGQAIQSNLETIDKLLERLPPDLLAEWQGIAKTSGMGLRPGFLHALLSAAKAVGL